MKRLAPLVCACLLLVTLPASGQRVEGFPPCRRANELPPGAPVNVELATVTDTEFVVTWMTCSAGRPMKTDSIVSYREVGGDHGGRAHGTESAFHHIRVTDLKPGTTYTYIVTSNGIQAPQDRLHPGIFTTLTPPPGKELFTVAVLADIHLGERVSGLATSDPTELPPGYRNDLDYPYRMLEAAVDGVNSEDVSLTLVPADNSSHGDLHDLTQARKQLSRLKRGYMIARGPHDRPNQSEAASSECPPDGDCFRRVFRSGVRTTAEPQHVPQVRSHRKWMFIALDSANLESGMGEISDEQLAWLERRLKKAEKQKRPSVIFFHHPVAEYSSTLAVPPAVFGVNQEDAQEFLALIGGYDVRLVLNSHTHRNWIAYSPHTGRMPILELGPTKEYPGGYSLFRFYEGGFMRTWIPIKCEFCKVWRETTRGQYLSMYPFYTTGSLRDRNFVHHFDSPDVPGIPSIPMGIWPPAVPGEA